MGTDMEAANNIEWREAPIPGYSVSSSGLVRNDSTKRILCPMMQGQKRCQYQAVNLAGTVFKVHKLVYETFIGSIPKGLGVCHKDDNRLNNAPMNLYAGTAKQNVHDRVRNGSQWPLKLLPETAAEIKNSKKTGKALSVEYNVSQQTICDIRKGRRKVIGNG